MACLSRCTVPVARPTIPLPYEPCLRDGSSNELRHTLPLRISARIGSSIWKVEPFPGVDSTEIRPPCIGATLRYLPAYSPDLNPIEHVFSKLKAALRKGAARTVTRLVKLIGRLATTLALEECANYFQHAGYGA